MTRLTEFVASRGPVEVYEDCWVPGSLEPFARSLAEIASPGDHVLDVGSGTGLLAQYASERVGDSGRVTALEHPAGNLKSKFARNGELRSGFNPIGAVLLEHVEDDGAEVSTECADGLVVFFALSPFFLIVAL